MSLSSQNPRAARLRRRCPRAAHRPVELQSGSTGQSPHRRMRLPRAVRSPRQPHRQYLRGLAAPQTRDPNWVSLWAASLAQVHLSALGHGQRHPARARTRPADPDGAGHRTRPRRAACRPGPGAGAAAGPRRRAPHPRHPPAARPRRDTARVSGRAGLRARQPMLGLRPARGRAACGGGAASAPLALRARPATPLGRGGHALRAGRSRCAGAAAPHPRAACGPLLAPAGPRRKVPKQTTATAKATATATARAHAPGSARVARRSRPLVAPLTRWALRPSL